MSKRTCSVDGCERPYRCTGYCSIHYNRFLKHGTPEPPILSTEDRFWNKVLVAAADECWLWVGAKKPHGYGNFKAGSQTILPHRFSYEITKGSIPPGFEVDHLCYQPACVNPAHLEAVPPLINKRRQRDSAPQRNARKTHCKQGHEFNAENTYRQPNKPGRTCRQCTREAGERYRARLAAQSAA